MIESPECVADVDVLIVAAPQRIVSDNHWKHILGGRFIKYWKSSRKLFGSHLKKYLKVISVFP